jgi:hypothetical protein
VLRCGVCAALFPRSNYVEEDDEEDDAGVRWADAVEVDEDHGIFEDKEEDDP